MFHLEIDTGNAAFEDDTWSELQACWDRVMRKTMHGEMDGKVMDSNGNTVGHFEWKED